MKTIEDCSKITKIRESQFYKTIIHKKTSKHSTNRFKFGTISLRYAGSVLLKEILLRIESFKKLTNMPL